MSEYSPFTDYVVDRIEKNKNFLCSIVGQPGSGKSYAALRWAEVLSERLDTEFSVDNVTFKPAKFMERINSDDTGTGSVLILDEAGVAVNSRDWQSDINQLINYVVQTFRHENYVVFFCVPDFGFIDKAVRKLLHCLVEMTGIDHELETSKAKPLLIQTNTRSGDMYYKYLQYRDRGDAQRWTKLKRVYLNKPGEELIDSYETKKTVYTQDLNKEVERKLRNLGSDDSNDLTEKQERALKLYNSGMTVAEVSDELGIAKSTVSQRLQGAEKKGYKVERPA